MEHALTTILCFVFCTHALAQGQTQEMDKELSDLAEKLATPITDHSRKKVTVLDFTDLQGNPSELGKYIAEQLTINFVMGKREFAVLDRANLRKILEEHKLTASGLVDPENAKKLGQFAGVDALILGTIIPSSADIQLTAKVITTDTAEIIGANRARFTHSPSVALMLTNSVASQTTDGGIPQLSQAAVSKALQVDKNSQVIGDLLVKVESLKHIRAGNNNNSWPPTPDSFVATLVLANLNSSKALSIALTYSRPPSSLTNKRGDELTTGQYMNWVSGLGQAQGMNDRFQGQFTEIPSGKSVKATIKYWGDGGTLGDYPPHRLELPLLVGNEVDGRFVNVKQHTFMIDVEQGK
jgi:TolB-like protein